MKPGHVKQAQTELTSGTGTFPVHGHMNKKTVKVDTSDPHAQAKRDATGYANTCKRWQRRRIVGRVEAEKTRAVMWWLCQRASAYGSKERAKSRLIKAAIAPMAMILGITMATSATRHKCSMGISQRLNGPNRFPRVRLSGEAMLNPKLFEPRDFILLCQYGCYTAEERQRRLT